MSETEDEAPLLILRKCKNENKIVFVVNKK